VKLPGRTILKNASDLARGDRVSTKLGKGEFTSRVEEITGT